MIDHIRRRYADVHPCDVGLPDGPRRIVEDLHELFELVDDLESERDGAYEAKVQETVDALTPIVEALHKGEDVTDLIRKTIEECPKYGLVDVAKALDMLTPYLRPPTE